MAVIIMETLENQITELQGKTLKHLNNKEYSKYRISKHSPEHVEGLHDFDKTDFESAKAEFEANKEKDDFYTNLIFEKAKHQLLVNANFTLKMLADKIVDDMGWEDLDEFDEEDVDREVFENYLDEESEDIEELSSYNLEATNASTEQIIQEVVELLNLKFEKNYISRRKFEKYTNLNVDEDGNLNFEENGEDVTIRIADHTHNPRNGKNDLTVVISNEDPTVRKFYAHTDLLFNENNSVEEIVSDILNFWK